MFLLPRSCLLIPELTDSSNIFFSHSTIAMTGLSHVPISTPSQSANLYQSHHANLILRSSDEVDFKYFKEILSDVSQVFEDMFEAGESSLGEKKGELPVVKMAEDAVTIQHFLDLITPRQAFKLAYQQGPSARTVFEMVDKFALLDPGRSSTLISKEMLDTKITNSIAGMNRSDALNAFVIWSSFTTTIGLVGEVLPFLLPLNVGTLDLSTFASATPTAVHRLWKLCANYHAQMNIAIALQPLHSSSSCTAPHTFMSTEEAAHFRLRRKEGCLTDAELLSSKRKTANLHQMGCGHCFKALTNWLDHVEEVRGREINKF